MLSTKDPAVFKLIKQEEKRQREVLEMIAFGKLRLQRSLEALGTVLNISIREGYPKKRYYQGNAVADDVGNSSARKSQETVSACHLLTSRHYQGSP